MVLTPGIGMLSAEEERREIENNIIQYIRARMSDPSMSREQMMAFMKHITQIGIPIEIIERSVQGGIGPRPDTGQGYEDVPFEYDTLPNKIPSEVVIPGPTMASYGDVRSVLSPGRANIRTDPDPVGWPGEDLSGYNKTKFPVAEVLSPPVLANNFATPPPALPVDPFAFEDTKARAPRVEYQGSSGGLGNTRAMQEKAAFMASAPKSRQVTQNDPMGLWRTFGTRTPYTGNTLAVEQGAGYQTPREARRRPTYNRVPETKKSNRRYQPFAEMINAPWGIA